MRKGQVPGTHESERDRFREHIGQRGTCFGNTGFREGQVPVKQESERDMFR